MYGNLIKEMALYGVTMSDIAAYLGIHRNSAQNKIKGGSFSVDEALKIRDKFFANAEMQYLFEKQCAESAKTDE